MTAFPTNAALEAGVVADIESDVPRLVYADWLEENGDPIRAEFIRVDCALHDKSPADEDYQDLVERRRETHDGLVLRPSANRLPEGVTEYGLPPSPDEPGFGRGYCRGFPYWVAGPDYTMPKRDRRLRKALPELLRETTFRGIAFGSNPGGSRLDAVLSHPKAGAITGINLQNHCNDEDDQPNSVAVLAGSGAAASLESLGVQMRQTADLGILAAAAFPRLRRLHLDTGTSDNAASRLLPRLLKADWMSQLHALEWASFRDDVAGVWAALSAIPHLHTLYATAYRETDLRALAKPGAFPRLGLLRLMATELTEPKAASFAAAEFPRLAALNLADDLVPIPAFNALMAAGWFSRLKALAVRGRSLSDSVVAKLGKHPVAAGLRSLSFSGGTLGGKALTALARSCPRLTKLSFRAAISRKATVAQVADFLAGLETPELKDLDLSACPLHQKAARALAGNRTLARLTRLHLADAITDDGALSTILQSSLLGELVFLDLYGCQDVAAISRLLDPDVLPRLRHCVLPSGVEPGLWDELQAARGSIFRTVGKNLHYKRRLPVTGES